MAREWRIDMTMDLGLCIEIQPDEQYLRRVVNHVIYSIASDNTKWAITRIDRLYGGRLQLRVLTDVGILYIIEVTDEKACVVGITGVHKWLTSIAEKIEALKPAEVWRPR